MCVRTGSYSVNHGDELNDLGGDVRIKAGKLDCG